LWRISTDGGTEPLWARNGRELFYRQGNGVYSVVVTTSPTFASGQPQRPFEGSYQQGPNGRAYDVTPDGELFVMIPQSQTATRIHVVLNWFEELKRLVPAN
jgi:hypothetical protein